MKRVLRSILDTDGTISQTDLAENLQKVVTSRLEWQRDDDKKIYDFIKVYFQQRLEIPAKATAIDYFEKSNDLESLERIKDISVATPYVKTNFSHLVAGLLDDQNRLKALTLLRESEEIIKKGITIDGEVKRGVREGLQHFAQNANNLISPENNAKLRGTLNDDGQAVWEGYESAKFNSGKSWGRFTGLNEIDKICHGSKKGELWVHAAFAGELKSTFSMTWCYNLVTRYRTNVFYASLEMKYDHIRNLIYTIHSTNNKFELMGFKPLDYRKLRDGEFTSEEEAFLKIVIEDFTTNPMYGKFDVWSPEDDVTTDDIKMEAELNHKSNECGFLVIDHGGLVEPRKKKRNKDYTIELNSVIRDSKKIALHFNHGEGVPVLMLFQINRNGKTEADKAEGRYKLSALSYANECERSADVVTTTYLNDDHRREGTTLFCCLKNRDNPHFEPFTAKVNFSSRRILNMCQIQSAPGMSVEQANLAERTSELMGV